MQALGTPTLLKRDSNTDFFQPNFKIFKKTLFYKYPADASAGLRFPACNYVKKETPAKMFFCEFYKFFKNIFWQNTSGWLLLVFIWEFREVFQNTSFIEHLFQVQVTEFQPTDTVRDNFTSAFQAFYTRTTDSHSKRLKF